jgi:hypothetical protein
MTEKIEREAKLEQELEALLNELGQVDKELFTYENGYAATLLSFFLAMVGTVCAPNFNMFSVLLVGATYYLFARCGDKWSQLYDYRETVTARIVELRKQIHMLDHYG